MSILAAKRLVELKKQMDDLKEQLKILNMEYEASENEVIEYFNEQGMANITVDGRTVYIQRKIMPVAKTDMQAVVAAIKGTSLETLLGVNHNTLRGFINEKINDLFLENDDAKTWPLEDLITALPSELQETLDLTEQFKANVRKK